MKDLTVTQAADRLKNCVASHNTVSIAFDYAFKANRQVSMEWTVSTHTPDCEIFTAPTLRGAVELAENHHLGPHVGEGDLQEQLNVVD